MELTWTLLSEDLGERVDVARVPGGWLYRTLHYNTVSGQALAVAMAVLPERAE